MDFAHVLGSYNGGVSLVLLAAVVLLGVWIAMIQARARKLERRLDAIFEDLEVGNTAQMLVSYLNTVKSTAATVERVKEEHEAIAAIMPSVIRHVGLVRFSPFHDTGGDQSFTLALLDGRRDGVVVTALHSRADSRLYAKPVEGGESSYALTPEEREAMTRALGLETAVQRR